MLIFGMLSILQIAFLPGFLFLTFLSFRKGIVKTSILSFALSLSINYLLVLGLVLMHIYTRTNVYCIFFMEIILLVWKSWASLILYLQKKEFSLSKIKLNILLVFRNQPRLMLFAQLIAILSIAYLMLFFIFLDPNPRTIFSSWDAVVSWNRWAVKWYLGVPPPDSREYPQLLPLNISLTYQFIGTMVVQLFGKLICYIFPLAMVGCLWDLRKQQNEISYYWAIFFFIIFLIHIFATQSASGHVDVPVAAMSLFSLYPLLLINNQSTKEEIKKNIFVGAFICAGASVTKQPGIYLAMVYPLLTYLLVLRKITLYDNRCKAKILIAIFFFIILYMAPWYIYKIIKFHNGSDSSVVLYLLSGAAYSIADQTLYQRLISAITSLYCQYPLNKYFTILIIPTLFFIGSKTNKVALILSTTLVIPMSLLWAFGFSYDLRNIAFVIPFLSIVMGFGLQVVMGKLFQFSRDNQYLVAVIIMFSLTVNGLYLLNRKYDEQLLVTNQFLLQKELGNIPLNNFLYSYFSSQSPKGVILTNNILLENLPVLGAYYNFEGFASVQLLLDNIHGTHAKYLLVLEQNVENIKISTINVEHYLDQHEGSQYHKVYHEGIYLFYEVLGNV